MSKFNVKSIASPLDIVLEKEIVAKTHEIAKATLTKEEAQKLLDFSRWQQDLEAAITPHEYGVVVDKAKLEGIKGEISSKYNDLGDLLNIRETIFDGIKKLESPIEQKVCDSRAISDLRDDLKSVKAIATRSISDNGCLSPEDISSLDALGERYKDLLLPYLYCDADEADAPHAPADYMAAAGGSSEPTGTMGELKHIPDSDV